jgi:eukaryotic-like serine/threonine-protein kinase
MENEGSKIQVNLQDGSVFSIGGVKSTLAQLAEMEKISGESIVFSIGPTNEVKKTGSENRKTPANRGYHDQLERYKVANEIARGGMGSILKTEDRDLRRYVAMKVLLDPGETNAKMYERFVKEAQVTGFLEHPNIVPVHELGIDRNARPFFTMKLIGGESLGSVLKKLRNNDTECREIFPTRRLLGTFVQVCNAVSFAHSCGVIHRDLKPENIMLGEYGEVLVMDWGLAKIRDFEEILAPHNVADPDDYMQTQEGVVLGTPPYMPPEQATGDISSTDERSDVFALGAILYEIITGRMLYDGETVGEIINKAANADFELPSRVKKTASEIEKVCIKSLQMNKEERYQSVNELSESVKAYLDHRVIPAYNLKPWQMVAQSLGVVAFFVFLLPVLGMVDSMKYLGTISNLPSFLMIVLVAFLFCGVIVGHRSPLFRKHSSFSQARSYATIVLLEGSFWGGLLGWLSGFFAMLEYIEVTSTLRFDISLSLITILYFYGFYLLMRLGSVRELRKNSLFDNIAENSFPNLVRYTFLFLFPCVAFMLLYLISDPRDFLLVIQSLSLLKHPGYIPLYPIILYPLVLVFSLIYMRFVFTFRELIAAIEHFFAFLAGNEVADVNRIHAASVLRFLVETFLLSMLATICMLEISFLMNVESIQEAVGLIVFLLLIGFLPFCFYIGFNHILIPRFVGRRGATATTATMKRTLCLYYADRFGTFWTNAKYGRMSLIATNIAVGVVYAVAILSNGALNGTLLVVLSFATMVCVLMYANLKRIAIKKQYKEVIDGVEL